MMKVLSIVKHRTMLPSASSTGRASTCLSTGLDRATDVPAAEAGCELKERPLFNSSPIKGEINKTYLSCFSCGEEAGDLPVFVFRWERPLRSRRKDSRRLFLKLLRLEIGVSPAPEMSTNKNN